MSDSEPLSIKRFGGSMLPAHFSADKPEAPTSLFSSTGKPLPGGQPSDAGTQAGGCCASLCACSVATSRSTSTSWRQHCGLVSSCSHLPTWMALEQLSHSQKPPVDVSHRLLVCIKEDGGFNQLEIERLLCITVVKMKSPSTDTQKNGRILFPSVQISLRFS